MSQSEVLMPIPETAHLAEFIEWVDLEDGRYCCTPPSTHKRTESIVRGCFQRRQSRLHETFSRN